MKLKSCPFCGGEAFVATVEHPKENRPNEYRFHGQIICYKCQATAGTTGFDLTHEEATKKAIAAWNRRAQPENKPLTLDELRQMDGEPVWVMHQDGSGARWGIVKDTEYGLCAVVDDDTAYWFTDVCGTIAYRSKPKEEV